MKETVTIVNRLGLHARAAAKFDKTAQQFDAQVLVSRPDGGASGDQSVTGTSILGLMMLAAEPGTQIEIAASGTQANEVLEALKQLIADKFGEGE
ncbi:MAG: HPr family phosphocarrier protein [Alphaproteobacteria bacterium]|nr:HPr family phosphocarrier protein [Alphaproteobacteria bacterium]